MNCFYPGNFQVTFFLIYYEVLFQHSTLFGFHNKMFFRNKKKSLKCALTYKDFKNELLYISSIAVNVNVLTEFRKWQLDWTTKEATNNL